MGYRISIVLFLLKVYVMVIKNANYSGGGGVSTTDELSVYVFFFKNLECNNKIIHF